MLVKVDMNEFISIVEPYFNEYEARRQASETIQKEEWQRFVAELKSLRSSIPNRLIDELEEQIKKHEYAINIGPIRYKRRYSAENLIEDLHCIKPCGDELGHWGLKHRANDLLNYCNKFVSPDTKSHLNSMVRLIGTHMSRDEYSYRVEPTNVGAYYFKLYRMALKSHSEWFLIEQDDNLATLFTESDEIKFWVEYNAK